jgi:UDP-N-acetylmuramate: L-alanyl-gamma-D-glutamyl-meso-diaminopimelate ligase
MRIHFISIGGSIMHNLAIALKLKGHDVSGSDDEIFDPAKTRLQQHAILPETFGWHESRISKELDAVILGMHAREDNPELQKALLLGLNVYSFPEYLYLNSEDKTRIAIAGSHGKTSITSMVMHVLQKYTHDFDYMVGALVPGFDQGLKLTENAPTIVLEADEYLSSCINREPKFLWYKPQIALISGIAWDHMNVFPTFDIYVDQFRKFIASMPEKAVLVYYQGDELLNKLVQEFNHIRKLPYNLPAYSLVDGKFVVQKGNTTYDFQLYGSHNMLNAEGARLICKEMGVSEADFYESIADFRGAGKRLEVLYENQDFISFRDFAHAPSKVKATVEGVKQQYPDRKLIACLELHTYSSLNPEFIPQYDQTLSEADVKIVYINEEAVKLKRMKLLTKDEVERAFGESDLRIVYRRDELEELLKKQDMHQAILLLMSSGHFGGMDVRQFKK